MNIAILGKANHPDAAVFSDLAMAIFMPNDPLVLDTTNRSPKKFRSY